MPIVVRPEDIRLSKKMLRKDILYRLGLEAGLIKSTQEMLIAMIERKTWLCAGRSGGKVKGDKRWGVLHALIKRLISSEDILEVLKRELSL